MAGTFWKWLIPGILTVAGGTMLAVAQTGAAVTSDLGARATAALDPATFSWATVTIEGRDAILGGTATTQQAIDDAMARLGTVRGVRMVDSEVALAEFVSPFPFDAVLKDGKITLSGAYPDEAVHTGLLAAAKGATDKTKLFSGAPQGFEVGARFGLSALSQLDQGEVRLADLSMTVTGRAKSVEAYDALQKLSKALPPGVELASLSVSPPLAAPYVWTATYDGTSVAISGDVPRLSLADQLRIIVPANVPVSSGLALASGEPAGFEANTLTLLKSLLALESGEASIKDGVVTLSGAPATTAAADEVTAAVQKLGGTVSLEPPRVADYALGIDKTADHLAFSGFVPDAATRDKLGAFKGADISKLALARGATEHFAAALDFGLAVLGKLGDGRFDIKADRLSIGGRATTVADFKAASDLVAQGAPQGLTLVAATLHPPVAKPFTWSAVKDAGGKITVSGFVPDEKVRAALQEKMPGLATDSADPADGAPDNFAASALKGLDIFALLDSGSMVFDGSNWAIDGNVSDTKKGFAADAAYSIAGLRTAGWSYAVHLPPAPAAAPLPTIAPYTWRAQKTSDGAVAFSGFVPALAFQTVAKNRVPGVADSTVLGAGAPADFPTTALSGLDALLALEEGSLALNGNRWTLTGVSKDSATRTAVQEKLTAAVNAANWQIAIQAKDAGPIVAPYLWSATKAADGSIVLDGYVPNAELKAAEARDGVTISRDSTTIASGEPTGFADDLSAALDALSHLGEGKAAFDGSKWLLTGSVASDADGAAALAALDKGSKGGALWTNALSNFAPAPSSSASLPDISSLEPLSQSPEAASSAAASAEPSSAAPEPSSSASEPASSAEPASSEASAESSSVIEPSSEASAPGSSSADATASSASSAEPQTDRGIETTPPMPDTLVFEASRQAGQPIALKGAVPADAAIKYFSSLAGGVTGDNLTVQPDLPADFMTSAIWGINALSSLTEGRLGFDGQKWWLRGKAGSKAISDKVSASIATLPNSADWSVSFDMLPPLASCREAVSDLAKKNGILFKSGNAVLMPSSMPILDDLADDLKICPKTYVHVQGHTDADGDPDVNLALSVARAEAVVAELVKRGIDEARLYAEGYGETAPLVPNDTKDNKAKNRRIAFVISEE